MLQIMDVPAWIAENLEFPYKEQTVFQYDGYRLVASITVPNSVDLPGGPSKGEMIQIHANFELRCNSDGWVSRDSVTRMVFIVMGSFAMHEFCELFKREGRAEYDPHGNMSHIIFENALAQVAPEKRVNTFPTYIVQFEGVSQSLPDLSALFENPQTIKKEAA